LERTPRNVDVGCFYGVSWFLSLTWDFRGILGELFCKSLICLGKRQIPFGDDKPELQRQRQLQPQNTRILRLARNDDIKQTVTRTTTEADPYGMQTRTARATGAAATVWVRGDLGWDYRWDLGEVRDCDRIGKMRVRA
jgi:hypothetical protein